MKIIDIHTHAWPDAVAPNAIASLERMGTLKAFYDGTVAGLRGIMQRSDVSVSVVQPVATKASQVPASTTGRRQSAVAASSPSVRCIPSSRTRPPRSLAWPRSACGA